MNDTPELVKPLSLWDKIKTGAKSFGKAALHYLPKGLLFVGLIFGASALLEHATGLGLLGVTESLKSSAIVSKVLISLAIGSTISGGIGAYKGITEATAQNTLAMQAQAAALERSQSMVPERQRNIGYEDPMVPTGIPVKTADMLAHTVPHLIH